MKDRNRDSQSIFIAVCILAFVYTRIQEEFNINVFLQIFSIASFTWWGVSIWTETNSLGVGYFIGRAIRIIKDSLQFILWELPKGLFFFGTYLFSCCSQNCQFRGAIGRKKVILILKDWPTKLWRLLKGNRKNANEGGKEADHLFKKGQ